MPRSYDFGWGQIPQMIGQGLQLGMMAQDQGRRNEAALEQKRQHDVQIGTNFLKESSALRKVKTRDAKQQAFLYQKLGLKFLGPMLGMNPEEIKYMDSMDWNDTIEKYSDEADKIINSFLKGDIKDNQAKMLFSGLKERFSGDIDIQGRTDLIKDITKEGKEKAGLEAIYESLPPPTPPKLEIEGGGPPIQTPRLGMMGQERFVQAGMGSQETRNIVQKLAEGALVPPKPKEYEPKPYTDAQGKPIWVKPGERVPEGAKPYEKGSEEKGPYKIGQIIPGISVGEEKHTFQVVGFDKEKMPILKLFAKGEKTTTEKVGQNWILPDRSSVISYDGGRTYASTGGKTREMPTGAIKVPGGASLAEINVNQAKQQAAAELTKPQTPSGVSPKLAALEGTGPYKQLASAFESVVGGLGMDLLIGKQGFFPATADAKQYLRSVKQLGKAALMNSARGAIWEQQRINELFPDPDKILVNPRIEARKFGNLLSILTDEKTYNNRAIVDAITPGEVEKYRASNNEIDRLLALISEPKVTGGSLTVKDKELVDKYLKKGR